MKSPKTLFIAFALCMFASACTFTTTRLNREEDKAAAENVAKKFFGYLKSKDYDATLKLCSDSLWVNTTKENLKNVYTYSDDKLGDLKSDSLVKWQTKVVSGTDPWARYELIYKNHYQNGPADVDILLTKESNGEIRILGYHINSALFLKK